MTSDPIGLAGGTNTYGYVGSNPLFWIDPKGLVNVAPEYSGGNQTIYPPDYVNPDGVSDPIGQLQAIGKIIGTPIAATLAVGVVFEASPLVAVETAKFCGKKIVQNKEAVRKAACAAGFAAACAQGNLNQLDKIRDDLEMLERIRRLIETQRHTNHLPR